jgi:hypothetical protein
MQEHNETLAPIDPTLEPYPNMRDQVAEDAIPTVSTTTSPSFSSPRNQYALTSPLVQTTPPQSSIPLTYRCPQSHFTRGFDTLTSMYGNRAQEALTAETIIEIIQLGNFFLRDDLESFTESFRLASGQNSIWDRPSLMNPTEGGTLIERLFNGFRCAQILEQSSTVDPVRLRIARIVLYHYYEQLYVDAQSDSDLLSRRSRGRSTSSVVTDKILEDMYGLRQEQFDSQTWTRRRASLQKHKKLGKRWCMVVDHLGFGILLTCHPSLATQM